MDGTLSDVLISIRAVILYGDIDGTLSQTHYRDLSGAAHSYVYRRVALDRRDPTVAQRGGKVISAVRRAVGHIDDQRFADADACGFLRFVGGRGDIDRFIPYRRINGRRTALTDRQMDL